MGQQVAADTEKRAAADRDLALKQATYKSQINAAQASAAVAYDIEMARQQQQVNPPPPVAGDGRRHHHLDEPSRLGWGDSVSRRQTPATPASCQILDETSGWEGMSGWMRAVRHEAGLSSY